MFHKIGRKRRIYQAGLLVLLLGLVFGIGGLFRSGPSAPASTGAGLSAPSGAASLRPAGGGGSSATTQGGAPSASGNGFVAGQAFKHDVSPALRDLMPLPLSPVR